MRRIFLVSDRTLRPERGLVALLEEAAASGVDRIQLREKDLPVRELLELARAVVTACRPHGCRIYVNGRADVAIAAGADGVHLPANGLPASAVRQAAGAGLEVGVSTHSLDELRAARAAGADYAFFGPVFATPGKQAYGPPVGVEALREAVKEAGGLAIYAIGGVDRGTVDALADIPLTGVALIRGILTDPDIPAAVGALRERLSGGGGSPARGFGMLGEGAGEEESEDEDEEDEDEDDPEDEGGWGYG